MANIPVTACLCVMLLGYGALSFTAGKEPAPKVRVVVIGAGAAGISATQRLLEQNFEVILLEASHRWGGRLWSTPANDGWLELGGQWVHGNGHYLYNLTSSLGLLKPLDKSGGGALFRVTGGVIPTEDEKFAHYAQISSVSDSLLNASAFSPAQLQNVSAGEVILRKYLDVRKTFPDPDFADQFFDYSVRGQKGYNAVDSLFDLAIRSYSDYIVLGPPAVDLNVPYTNVLQAIGPDAIRRVKLNNYVSQIRLKPSSSSKAVHVITRSGEMFDADHVILTASMGHLKERVATLFNPPLTLTKQAAIQAVGMGTYGKIHLVYNRPWWNDVINGLSGWGVFFDNDSHFLSSDRQLRYKNRPWTRGIEAFKVNPSASNVLLAMLGGRHAEEMEKLSDFQIAGDLTALLQGMVGDNVTLPLPNRVYRGFWHSNELFRGTYSYFSNDLARRNLTLENLVEPEYFYTKIINNQTTTVPGLMFAGEATHSSYTGTVTAAVLTGFREADRITRIYND